MELQAAQLVMDSDGYFADLVFKIVPNFVQVLVSLGCFAVAVLFMVWSFAVYVERISA